MTDQDPIEVQQEQASAACDSQAGGAGCKACSCCSRKSLVVGVLLFLVAGGIWVFQSGRQSAAEQQARAELEMLGALVTLDASRAHVQGVNLSLPAVREQVELAMPLLAKLGYLEVLTLSNTAVTDEQMAHVAACRNLTSLVLKQTALGDAALVHIARLPRLSTLYLNESKITSEGLNEIGKLQGLTILDLSGTSLDGDLAGLATLGALKHLLLNGVELGETAVETIGKLPNLTRLTVNGSGLDAQAIEKLEQAKPGIRIDNDANDEKTDADNTHVENADAEKQDGQ
ncbi:MAG: hypothetical protein KDA57_08620 [Planctomycetales bacterium]|nr:hypothetical protein [Planctomycetales bacterium]